MTVVELEARKFARADSDGVEERLLLNDLIDAATRTC
jgi:hypothetical protein